MSCPYESLHFRFIPGLGRAVGTTAGIISSSQLSALIVTTSFAVHVLSYLIQGALCLDGWNQDCAMNPNVLRMIAGEVNCLPDYDDKLRTI
jgi:hypothetical protein